MGVDLDAVVDHLRLNVASGDAAASTIRVYESHLRHFLTWCDETGRNPVEATEKDLALYRRSLAEDDYARTTIGSKLAAVRWLYTALVADGLCGVNPAAHLSPPRTHTSDRDRVLERYLTPEQVADLLEAPDIATAVGKRDRAMLAVMYYHGLRVSEVTKLRMRHMLQGDPVRLSIRSGKGDRDRMILMVEVSEAILQDWLDVRDEWVTDASDGAVFVSFGVSAAGTPLTTCGVRYVVNKYLKTLGYYRLGLSCHALRHSHAAHAVAAGADLVAVSHELGHSDLETTSVYMHVVNAMQQNPAALL